MNQTLIDLYQQMADLTKPKCGECFRPYSCCESAYCELADSLARENGIELVKQNHPTLPFMSENGCVVPPWLRPLCTLHTCQINSLGFDPKDMEWTEKYFDLRDRISLESLEAL